MGTGNFDFNYGICVYGDSFKWKTETYEYEIYTGSIWNKILQFLKIRKKKIEKGCYTYNIDPITIEVDI